MPDRCTFAVFVVGDGYLPGVLALKRSLDSVETLHPLIALALGCSDATLSSLEDNGITAIRGTPLTVPQAVLELNDSLGCSRWNQSFTKLKILTLTQFDAILMLDADMMVRRNIDELFDVPAMSAVVAGLGLNPGWRDLNSGLMLIKPSQELYNKAVQLLNSLEDSSLSSYCNGIGDQDILKALMPTWRQHAELHLPERYNAFQDCLGVYDARGYLRYEDVSVVHFELSPKPWMYRPSDWLKVVLRALKSRSCIELKALQEYRSLYS